VPTIFTLPCLSRQACAARHPVSAKHTSPASPTRPRYAFDGAESYRLRVPPNPPAKQFWSVTLYDADTRSLIQNKEQRSDRSSRHDLLKNADGSVDLYFGPTAPKGFENNWLPPYLAKRGSRLSGSMGRWNPISTRAGRYRTSRK
jgi:hypothetical protein